VSSWYNGGPSSEGSFDTTRWSLISAAGDHLSPKAKESLETLCRAYWHPLYAYARRKGLGAADAEDATQEFFRQMLTNNSFATVDRGRGSFRSFLLASMNHLLLNEWDKARTLKRGGGHQIISLDSAEAEGRLIEGEAPGDSAEKIFDRQWAHTILRRAMAQMREEFVAAGKQSHFEAMKGFLSDVAGTGDYTAVADELGITAGAVAVAVHRLRLRYRELVRAEVAQTVANPAELRVEMRHLFASLSDSVSPPSG